MLNCEEWGGYSASAEKIRTRTGLEDCIHWIGTSGKEKFTNLNYEPETALREEVNTPYSKMATILIFFCSYSN